MESFFLMISRLQQKGKRASTISRPVSWFILSRKKTNLKFSPNTNEFVCTSIKLNNFTEKVFRCAISVENHRLIEIFTLSSRNMLMKYTTIYKDEEFYSVFI